MAVPETNSSNARLASGRLRFYVFDPIRNGLPDLPYHLVHILECPLNIGPQPEQEAVVPLRQILAVDIGLGEADDCNQAPLLALSGGTLHIA